MLDGDLFGDTPHSRSCGKTPRMAADVGAGLAVPTPLLNRSQRQSALAAKIFRGGRDTSSAGFALMASAAV